MTLRFVVTGVVLRGLVPSSLPFLLRMHLVACGQEVGIGARISRI
jgi:hypothetical protein